MLKPKPRTAAGIYYGNKMADQSAVYRFKDIQSNLWEWLETAAK